MANEYVSLRIAPCGLLRERSAIKREQAHFEMVFVTPGIIGGGGRFVNDVTCKENRKEVEVCFVFCKSSNRSCATLHQENRNFNLTNHPSFRTSWLARHSCQTSLPRKSNIKKKKPQRQAETLIKSFAFEVRTQNKHFVTRPNDCLLHQKATSRRQKMKKTF